jgi:hypothetical protein
VEEGGKGKYFNLSSGKCIFGTSSHVGLVSAKWSHLDREATTGNNSPVGAVAWCPLSAAGSHSEPFYSRKKAARE